MTLDEIARTYGIEDQVRDMPDLRPTRHWAMRQAARATQASPRAVLRRLGHSVSIAIAVFALAWFAAHLISAAGQL